MIKHWRILLVLGLLASAFGLRAGFLAHPIWNVDEGVTFTVAEQIRHGAVIYRDAADHRNPLVPYLQAGVFALAGDWNATAVHASLALLLGFGAVGVWGIARRLGHELAGLVAAGCFTVLCFALPDGGDALAAHTEWYLILFSIAGFWSLAAALPRPSLRGGLVPGAIFGLALLCKQPGLLDFGTAVVLVALLALARPDARAGHARLVVGLWTGLVLVLGIAVAYFAWHGALRDLAYYAWTYNSRIYVPEIPLPRRLSSLLEPFHFAWQNLPAAFVLGVGGALLLLGTAARGLFRRPVEIPALPWLALGWTAGGIIAPALSGRGFSHYSIQIIPGLSLVCGWTVVQLWRWCAGRSRTWRWAGAGLLALALAHSGGKLVNRHRKLAGEQTQREALADVFQAIRAHTRPDERIFVWGFAPDIHFCSQRLPNTRFVYSNFLTGLVPWTNIDPLQDTAYAVAPGSWAQLEKDFARTPAAMIVDTGHIRENAKYPLRERAWLWRLVTTRYAEVAATVGSGQGIHLYRLLAPPDGRPRPPEASLDNEVQLTLSCVNLLEPVPVLSLHAPAGATQVDLFANGRLFRTLPLPDGNTAVAFFAPLAELPAGPSVFEALIHSPAGLRLSPPVTLVASDLADPARTAPGPAIVFLGREIRPTASETSVGPPTLRGLHPEVWQTHAVAKLVYRRPPGLRALELTFGLDEKVYFDTPAHPASDGVDFVVEFLADDATSTRLFVRRLNPAAHQTDRGPQRAEVLLPELTPGYIVVRVLPGPFNHPEFDWAYLYNLTASGFGPPLLDGDRAIPAERVSSNHAPVMTCDPEGKWIAHSPSSVSYELPPGTRSLTFSYGLEPASYDGSQSGRTDGIEVTVTAERPDGSSATIFERILAPADVAADRGRQTTRIELPDTRYRRVTIAIGPGPSGNVSFDWSYLADLRAEGPAPAAGAQLSETARPRVFELTPRPSGSTD